MNRDYQDPMGLDNSFLRPYNSFVEARYRAPASIAVSAVAVKAPGGT